MTDRFGPWTVHTPGECPVPPETMVQPQLRNETQILAEARPPATASGWYWEQRGDDTIAYYRVLLEPEWTTTYIGVFRGTATAGTSDLVRIRVPLLNGKPDLSRRPEWVV